ncbi:MAG: UDP-N-acetylmuramoyl-L-alanyl-D-glutamate--2,6-diaminopimelate ligase [Candidatus Aminicenantes bacterium]|nr:UDP-N-acetylmuramoyl-L-alanyl-D-glutamate--2,6-diaminopimelate ligase [Candidatus Aminicenantes bacterium]
MILEDVLKGVPVLSLAGDPHIEITAIAYASAEVVPGALFAALKGEKKDGHDFIPDALKRGAAAILSDRPQPEGGLEGTTAAWIQVFDPRDSLALGAANFYGHPARRLKLVGITGTKGKTTLTYLLEAILEKAGFTVGVIGTINYRRPGVVRTAVRTTPEAPDLQRMLAEMLEAGVTHCVMEVSSHALDRKRVSRIGFDVAVFTNLSGDHLDYHLTMEDYFEAKKKLFFLNDKSKRTAVVNDDDPWGQRLIAELPMTTIGFGLSPSALVRAERPKLDGLGIEALIRFPGGQVAIASPLSGKHNLYNILAAFSSALALGIPATIIRDGIAAMSQVPGRFERVDNSLGFHVYVDYAHTDAALRSILEAARELKPAHLAVVFGAGGDRDRSKRPRMGEAAAELADRIYLTSDNPRSEDPLVILKEIEKGLHKAGAGPYALIPDRREAIAKALSEARRGDIVIIAGKGHETYQEIGGRKHAFSDVETAREILRSMGSR